MEQLRFSQNQMVISREPKYQNAMNRWKEIREVLTSTFNFSAEVRKVIHITNVFERLNPILSKYDFSYRKNGRFLKKTYRFFNEIRLSAREIMLTHCEIASL